MELYTTIHQQNNTDFYQEDEYCLVPQRIWSYGFYNHQHSLQYALPLLLFQIIMFTLIMGSLRYILRLFKQPTIISEVMAGIIIGPTLLGSFKYFNSLVFPVRGQMLSDSLASMGAIFYLFVEGLKQDICCVTNAGKKELIIFSTGIISAYFFCWIFIVTIEGFLPESVQALGLRNFLPAAMAISNFTNIQPILAELGLLNTDLGRVSMTLAMLNGAFGAILSLVYQSILRSTRLGLISGIYSFTSCCLMYACLFMLSRPTTLPKTPDGSCKVDSSTVLMFLVSILVTAAISDAIGATIFHGPLLFGILIPPGPPLGSVLVQKIETFNRLFFLPHFFIFNGRKVDLFDIPDTGSWVIMQMTVVLGCLGKFLATLLAAMYYEIPYLESVTLSLIMCFKGLMELIVYIIWINATVIDDPTLTSLEIGTIMMTAITTPLVRNLARKATRPLFNYNGRSMQNRTSSEFRLIMCIFDEDIVPALLNLLEATGSTRDSPVSLYLLHLVELQGRGAPILAAHKRSNMSDTLHHKRSSMDHITCAFDNLVNRSGAYVLVNPFTSVSPCKTMHQDVCTLATEKKVSLVIVPLPKQTIYSEASAAQRVGRMVARNVLYEAPCSVGVLLDRNNLRTQAISRCNSSTSTSQTSFRVGTVFLGGGDDREALCFVSRLVENLNVSLLTLRCLAPYSGIDHQREKLLDDELMGEFRLKSLKQEEVIYREEMVISVGELLRSIRSMGTEFDLMIVGRRHPAHCLVVDALSDWSECVELGVIGDFLASSDFADGGASVLSIQQNSTISGLVNMVGL